MSCANMDSDLGIHVVLRWWHNMYTWTRSSVYNTHDVVPCPNTAMRNGEKSVLWNNGKQWFSDKMIMFLTQLLVVVEIVYIIYRFF